MSKSNKEQKTYSVATPVEREGSKKPFWQNVGRAFLNDGGSISIYLNALPVNGKLVIFEQEEKSDDKR